MTFASSRSRRQGAPTRSDADPRAMHLSVSPSSSFQNGTNTGGRNSPGDSSSGASPVSKKEEKRARAIRLRTRNWYRISPEVPE